METFIQGRTRYNKLFFLLQFKSQLNHKIKIYSNLTEVHFKLNAFIQQIFYTEKLLLKRGKKPRSAKKQQLYTGKEHSQSKELWHIFMKRKTPEDTLLSKNNNFYTMSSYAWNCTEENASNLYVALTKKEGT